MTISLQLPVQYTSNGGLGVTVFGPGQRHSGTVVPWSSLKIKAPQSTGHDHQYSQPGSCEKANLYSLRMKTTAPKCNIGVSLVNVSLNDFVLSNVSIGDGEFCRIFEVDSTPTRS